MATYAIGDVQGCHVELTHLLDLIEFDAARDRLWFVGDLVNRGPASLEVLRLVKGIGDSAIAILGNHDLHLLATAAGFARKRADDTFDDVLDAPERTDLLDWLRRRPLLHAEGGWLMVHAGLLPQWSAAKAQGLAHEVEAALRGPGYLKFLAKLYGGKPDAWDDALTGMDRLRVIVNAMTRMRFCTDRGIMEFHSKGETTQAPIGYAPWFDAPSRAYADHTIICGHWSALGLRIRADLLALDSGCVWGGSLSAIRLEDRRVYQVPCAGIPLPRH
jgi:bis(5'-nucleosyl)-tetraphosphatase (symmetrical)